MSITIIKLIALVILIPLLLVAVSAPIGATLCGWMSVGRIRRSNGRLRGKGLAWFAALCYPGLILLALLGAVAVILFRFAFAPHVAVSPGWGRPVVTDSHPTWVGLLGPVGLSVLLVVGLFVAIVVWAVRRKPGQAGVNATRTGSGNGCLIALLVCGILALPLILLVLAFFWLSTPSRVNYRSYPTMMEVQPSLESGPSIHRIEYRYPNAAPATLDESVAQPVALRLQGLPNVEYVTTHCERGKGMVYVVAKAGLSASQFSELNERIRQALNNARGPLPADVSLQSQSLSSSIPEVDVKQVDAIAVAVDRDKASALGVSLESIHETMEKVRGNRPDSPRVLRDLQQAVISAHGLRVPLDQVATFTMEKSPSAIINTYPAQPRAEAAP